MAPTLVATARVTDQRRVLLVEDDADLRSMLAVLLADDGLSVDPHATGEAALSGFDASDPDLAIVDLRLPGMSGFDVIRSIRERSDVPVIILTAQTASSDVVAGLDAGADDYVTKPFVVPELLARVHANLRRSATVPDELADLSIGDLVVRPRSAEVFVGGRSVDLTRTELRVLIALAAAHGDVVSREHLLSTVWRYDYLGDSRMVDAHIRRLRLKVEDDPAEPRRLLTVRGAGYRLVDPTG